MKKTIRVMFIWLAFAGTLWSAGQAPATKKIPMPDLMKPTGFFADNSQLYIVEKSTVSIYSKKNPTLVKTFGKAGEGPQEFKIHPSFGLKLVPMKDKLAITSIGKVSYYQKNGTFIKEMRHDRSGHIYAFGENLLTMDYEAANEAFTYYVRNHKQEKIAKLEGFPIPVNAKKQKYNPLVVYPHPVFSDGCVFLVHGTGVEINGYNSMGKRLISVKYNDEKLKVSEKYKEAVDKQFKEDPSQSLLYKWLHFPEYFPGIKRFHVSDKHIFIRTYRTRGENESEL
ncbi:MAG: hypothetical protein GY765_28535, partial [bacterium]|nr:hypothetical protein [bacterium]